MILNGMVARASGTSNEQYNRAYFRKSKSIYPGEKIFRACLISE